MRRSVAYGQQEAVGSCCVNSDDYRKGEIEPPDAAHVNRWIVQFDSKVHDPILKEVQHVLERTYLTRRNVEEFLRGISNHAELTEGKPGKFWSETSVLKIQRNGSSQKEMLQLLSEIIRNEHQVDIDASPQDGNVAVYLDDIVFSGGHVRSDLVEWVTNTAPKTVTINIIVLAYHSGGQWFANQKIQEAANKVGKEVKMQWWRIHELEDRRAYINQSDVLRPVKIPDHDLTQAYAKKLMDKGYPPALRTPGNTGNAKFFSSEEGRDLLEQQFLMKGTEIREQAPFLNEYQRPLGNMVLNTLGFGSMIVTFRNCANNCPLALWAGDPWNPLCPRRTN
jgi:hypothetical protein